MMTESGSLVLDLLTYIEQVEKLKAKPAFSVSTEFFCAYQADMAHLPGVELNAHREGEDLWLRLARLNEIAPPAPDEVLAPWLVLSKSPDKAPELKSELVVMEGRREVSRTKLDEHPEVRSLRDWYVENQWTPWAEGERPRRATIALYNRLFSLHQAIASDGAEAALELVWGIGNASWKKAGFATTLKHPLIVQPCQVTLDERTFELDIRPRDAEPRLESDCYAEMDLPGVTQLEAHWKALLETAAQRPNPFDESTFAGVLRAAVGHLDPSGTYGGTDSVAPPPVSDRLAINSSWVIFGRKRSADIYLEDVRRLKRRVEEADGLPDVINSLVQPGRGDVQQRAERPLRGLSSSDVATAADLYFPMAYNDEQVAIVQKLEAHDGVVVQGPPGTGKTHTIANVICHYLAQGKRVLVTAKGESALAVLRDKLPERIRPLSVALLSDEHDGMKQFEHSIQTVASGVASFNPLQAKEKIEAGDALLNRLHAQISDVDSSIAHYAAQHMCSYSYRGRSVDPVQLARDVIAHAPEFSWLTDEVVALRPESSEAFGEPQVQALRIARMRVGADLSLLTTTLADPADLPDWEELSQLHSTLIRARAIDAQVTSGQALRFRSEGTDVIARANQLLSFLNDRFALSAKLAELNLDWQRTLAENFRLKSATTESALLQALPAMRQQIDTLEKRRRQLVLSAIVVPKNAERESEIIEAITRLSLGKSPFTLPFGKASARKLLAEITVLGGPPATTESWAEVLQLLLWRNDVRVLIARWNALANEFNLEPVDTANVDAAAKRLAWMDGVIGETARLVHDFDQHVRQKVVDVFGEATASSLQLSSEAALASTVRSLMMQIERAGLDVASKRVSAVLKQLDQCGGLTAANLRTFFRTQIGNAALDLDLLREQWAALESEANRLHKLGSEFSVIRQVSAKLEELGGRQWAKQLRTMPASADLDALVPTNWADAWSWRVAVQTLDQIDGHKTVSELLQKRKNLTTQLAQTYQEVIADKTWLGVFNNSPDSVRQSLQLYLNSVQAMGSGTGVRALRHRRVARGAMLNAYRAVPCWVLPHWRVSETLPADIGLFDLVVVDEASQSDIWALPALLRGKKLLVVGDHKQVSPSAVGMAEQKIVDLVRRFLGNQPHGSEMTPDKSIYDLARVVFAGSSVMLKEHFRSVPAIIEYSNREFYEGDIRPLRLPTASERLDPPLIDVYVRGGYRKGDVNPPEAQAVVNEILSILADEQFSGRSIGVVTLQGTEQAAHIHAQVHSRVPPSEIIARKIAVGPPAVFQGRERDIMLVSMVLAPGNRAAANKADMQQRFNVALSRARDRMYLFRSVRETDFAEDTLNGRLMMHFRQPFRRDERKVGQLRELCESDFERDLFDELTRRNYRVTPQVPCGGYRIDMVVEGAEGRRLAIECDGDRYHGPGQWGADMIRQRTLERAGWVFWRCFASSFVRRREEVMSDLLLALAQQRIEPIGHEASDNESWVFSKEVDPFEVESSPADTTLDIDLKTESSPQLEAQ